KWGSADALPRVVATGLCTSRQPSCGCTMYGRLCDSGASGRRACCTSLLAVLVGRWASARGGSAAALRPAVAASALRHCRASSVALGGLPGQGARSRWPVLQAVAPRVLAGPPERPGRCWPLPTAPWPADKRAWRWHALGDACTSLQRLADSLCN